MTTKKCPFCAEEIQAEALKCKHCGSWLKEDAPPSPEPAKDTVVDESQPGRAEISVIGTGGKVFRIASIVVGYLLGNLFAVAGMINIDEDLGPPVMILGLLLIIYALLIQCMLLHRLWAALQGRGARTTPGKAVGFLFIPFFNFYWIFQAIWGWAVDFNLHIGRSQMSVPRMHEGLALTVCILAVSCVVPILGFVACFANLVVLPIFLGKAINRVNALADAGG